MAAAELTTTDTEQAKIERWRAGELERAGYEASAAALLAGRADIDLHYAAAHPSSRCKSCSSALRRLVRAECGLP